MTDGIRGPWFGNGRHPWRHGRDPELEIRELRNALHAAVGGVRQALRDTPGEWRTSLAYNRVLHRLGRHGVVVDLRDGLLDVPAELPHWPKPWDGFVSRTILHTVARDVALDEELRDLLGGGPTGSAKKKLGDVIAEAQALGTEEVWRTRVAEPLAQVDRLWRSATRAVLLRDPDTTEMLWRLDALLPAASGPSRSVKPVGAFLGKLHTRIVEGDVAWDEAEHPAMPSRLPPRPSAAPEPATPPNPWLAVADSSPGAAHNAVVWFWEWTHGLYVRLHACVVSGLLPIAASVYWEALARALVLLAPAAPVAAAPATPAPAAPAPAVPAAADPAPATALSPSVPGPRTARPRAVPALVAPVPPTSPEEAPSAPPWPVMPPPAMAPAVPRKPTNSPAPSQSPVKVAEPVRMASASVLTLAGPEAEGADIREVLGIIARTMGPIPAGPNRRRHDPPRNRRRAPAHTGVQSGTAD